MDMKRFMNMMKTAMKFMLKLLVVMKHGVNIIAMENPFILKVVKMNIFMNMIIMEIVFIL